MSVELVPYAPALRREVARFLTELGSGELPRCQRYIDWLYHERPGRARACLAVHDGSVIGMRGALGQAWQRGERRGVLWSASDTMLKNGESVSLDVALTARLFESFGRTPPPFVDLGAAEEAAPARSKQGWRGLGSWMVAQRRLTPRPALNPRGEVFAILDGHSQSGMPRRISCSIEPKARAMARMVARVTDGAFIRPVRDASYYTWRYRNPLSQYRFLFLDQAPLQGFLVLQSSERGGARRVNVIEWEGATTFGKALLLEAAMGWGNFDGLSVWSSSFSCEDERILSKLGFDLGLSEGAPPIPNRHIFVRPGRADFRLECRDRSRWQMPGAICERF
jgi:hypothetical protein